MKFKGEFDGYKTSCIGGVLSLLAVLFQSIPVFFSEVFIFATILSTIPIYIATRINTQVGILSYFVVGIIIILFSVHEGIFFFCTNGILGLSLGISSNYFNERALRVLLSGIGLTIGLSTLNYLIGIPVFGTEIPGSIPVQLLIILCFSSIYSFIYTFFADLIYRKVIRSK